MALQRGMGILSERWPWLGVSYFADPPVDGSSLACDCLLSHNREEVVPVRERPANSPQC